MFVFGCSNEDESQDVMEIPSPPAVEVTTSPAEFSEVYSNSGIIMTFDEAIDSVTVNGLQAIGSGKTWTINLSGMSLAPGSHSLAIEWVNIDGSIASDSVTFVVPQSRAVKTDVVSTDDIGLASGSYTLISLEFFDGAGNFITQTPPEVDGDVVIVGNKITLSLDNEDYVWYFEIDEDLGFISLYGDIDKLLLDQIGDYKLIQNGFIFTFFDSDFVEVKTSWRRA